MSQIYGNVGINDGCILHLDAGNPKSYIGESTVNLCGDMSTFVVRRPIAETLDTNNWNSTIEKPPENIGTVYKQISGSLTSTWSGNSYGYWLKSYTYEANIQYTLSVWVFLSNDCDIDSIPCSIESVNQIISQTHYDMTKKGVWQKIYITINNFSTLNSNIIPVYPAKNGVTDGSFTGFFMWGGPQLEQKSHVTPFVNGTRNTWNDLSGYKHHLDISTNAFDQSGSLIYNGDADQSTDKSVTGVTVGNSFVIETVIKPTDVTGRQGICGHFINGYSSPPGGGIYIENGVVYGSVITGSQVYRYAHGGTLLNNNLYHIIYTINKDTGLMYLYINGDLIDTETFDTSTVFIWGGTQVCQDGRFYVGRRFTNNAGTEIGFKGYIYVVKKYDGVSFDINTVKFLYNSYKGRYL